MKFRKPAKLIVPPPEELLEYSQKHLLYNIEMLVEGNKLLETRKQWVKEREDRIKLNSLVESFATRVRSLADFLSSRGKEDTDMLAFYYATHWKPTRDFDAERQQVNKQVAHSTTKCTDNPQDKQWEHTKICDAIMEEMGSFCEKAENIHPDLREEVSKYAQVKESRQKTPESSAFTMATCTSRPGSSVVWESRA